MALARLISRLSDCRSCGIEEVSTIVIVILLTVAMNSGGMDTGGKTDCRFGTNVSFTNEVIKLSILVSSVNKRLFLILLPRTWTCRRLTIPQLVDMSVALIAKSKRSHLHRRKGQVEHRMTSWFNPSIYIYTYILDNILSPNRKLRSLWL